MNNQPMDDKGRCAVIGGDIAYKVFNTKASNRLPIIVIHGGPGTPHAYLEPLADLLPEHPVIFYDQLDCGFSDKPNHQHLWQIERFVDEIEKLRCHLDLDRFHLYAHSAGTMIGFDYALAHPERLDRLILASPILSMDFYRQTMNTLLGTFPDELKKTLQSMMEHNPVDAIDLMEATAFFAENHVCRLPVWPDKLLEASLNTNIALRDCMWGKNDFLVTGHLKTYERTEQYSHLRVKTLLTVGEYDFITPAACCSYAQSLPDTNYNVINQASHHPHLENPEVYARVLGDFLKPI